MRQFIAGAREKGALPMICTPIPRNNFKEGKLPRSEYQTWSEEIAAAAKIPLFDIAELIATQYEAMGPDKVEPLFHGDHTHTGLEGAEINADAVEKAIRTVDNPLKQYVKDTPPKTCIDPDTAHRVIRLTDQPGSASLYFNQNGYTTDGKNLVYTT